MRHWIAVLAVPVLLAATAALAQSEYPVKTVRFVVPYPPAGPTDLMARSIAVPLSQALGQQVVIDNRPGAGGNVGAELVSKAPADGYTMLMGAISTHSINISLYSKLPFHPTRDFVPITQVSWIPLVICTHPSLPVKNVADLVRLAKARPGEIAFGSSGNGGGTHLAGELFNMLAGVKLLHVPYKGLGPATIDLMAGSIPTLFNDLTTALPQVKSGRLNIIGVSTPQRVPQLPDVPPIGETVKGYEAYTWFGSFFPAKTPPEIVARMSRESMKVLQSDDIKRRFAEVGAVPVGGTPQAFATFMESEIAKWAKVIKASGAKVD